MESRPLRYFVAVAEELNFARAAERLGISPPPLSRAIRQLESELGAVLFERTTHSVTLTPAGEVLLAEAPFALEALEAAGRRARRAAAAEPKLALAVKADGDAGLLEAILARYAADPAALPVSVRLCAWHEQSRLLRQGEADVALAYEPYDRTGLDAEYLTAEPRVAALAARHPLAARAGLSLADLGLRPDEVHRYIDEIRGKGQDLAQLLTLVGLGEVVPCSPRPWPTAIPARASSTVPSWTHPLPSWPSPGRSSPARRPPRHWSVRPWRWRKPHGSGRRAERSAERRGDTSARRWELVAPRSAERHADTARAAPHGRVAQAAQRPARPARGPRPVGPPRLTPPRLTPSRPPAPARAAAPAGRGGRSTSPVRCRSPVSAAARPARRSPRPPPSPRGSGHGRARRSPRRS